MGEKIKLNSYLVRYQTISSSGVLGVTYEKYTTEAKNDQDAIQFVKSEILANGYSGIRVAKVEKLNEEPVQNLKKKKTIWGWVFSFMFVSAMLAKLIPRLLS